MASTAEGVYVIGGLNGRLSRRIDEYRNGSWRNAGELKSNRGRNLHSAIILGDRLLVIGGYTCHNLAAAPWCRYNNQFQG